MNNTLVTSHTNHEAGLMGRVWLTVNGKWVVTYHDIDAGEQIGLWTECSTLEMAEAKAHAFAHGKADKVSIHA